MKGGFQPKVKEVTKVMSNSRIDSPESSESWLSSKGKQLQEGDVLELWKQYSVNELAHLDLHFKYANWYSAFFIALFGGYVIGLTQYFDSLASILFLALPSLVIVLAQLGKKALDRFYRRFLETVVMEAKLEKLLGLDSAIKPGLAGMEPYAESTKILWPEDRHFMPLRYVKSVYDPKIKNSEDFIRINMKLGANKTTHGTFLTFQITAMLLLLGGIVLSILAHAGILPIN